MRIAIISDIHANTTALNTVLEDIQSHTVDEIVCLGDIVGYGYDPQGCINICRENNIQCILGNHDACLIGRLETDWFNNWAAEAIKRQIPHVSEDNKAWLARLPYDILEGCTAGNRKCYAHGVYVPPDSYRRPIKEYYEYILGFVQADQQYNLMILNAIDTLFVGHTHYANAYLFDESARLSEWYIDIEDETPIDCKKNSASIINVGSVGYPRNQPYSVYGIFDNESKTFQYRVLPFDFDDYIAKMKKAKAPIPRWLPERQKEAAANPV